MRQRGLVVGGVLAHGLHQNDRRTGFDVQDLISGERVPLCRVGASAAVRFGPYGFFASGLEVARQALSLDRLAAADVAVVDEIGRWELQGGGWAPELDALVDHWIRPLILVVRDTNAAEVERRWHLQPVARLAVASATPVDVAAAVDPGRQQQL